MQRLVASLNGTLRTDLAIGAIDHILESRRNIVWLDIEDPTEADQALLAEEFGFHPLAIEDAIRSHERPKVDAYGPAPDQSGEVVGLTDQPDEGGAAGFELQSAPFMPPATPEPPCGSYYFVVFYAAAFDTERAHIGAQALNLFIGANYLVTVHRGPMRYIPETIARWQAPNSPLESKVSDLVHALLDAIVDDYFPLMDQVADRVEDLEDTIFVHFDEAAIQIMFGLKKDLLAMRRVVAPERDVLNVLLRRQLPIFRADDVAYLQDVYDHIVRVTDNIDTYRDLLTSALDSYLSLQSNKLNEVVKVLTIASIILMADALVTGIYGMNFTNMPELEWGIGHGWALALMAIITIGLVLYFKRKRWL